MQNALTFQAIGLLWMANARISQNARKKHNQVDRDERKKEKNIGKYNINFRNSIKMLFTDNGEHWTAINRYSALFNTLYIEWVIYHCNRNSELSISYLYRIISLFQMHTNPCAIHTSSSIKSFLFQFRIWLIQHLHYICWYLMQFSII